MRLTNRALPRADYESVMSFWAHKGLAGAKLDLKERHIAFSSFLEFSETKKIKFSNIYCFISKIYCLISYIYCLNSNIQHFLPCTNDKEHNLNNQIPKIKRLNSKKKKVLITTFNKLDTFLVPF